MKVHYYNDDIVDICDNRHYTVDEIFDELVKKDPKVGRSSVYRNVELLVQKWQLNKVTWIGKKAYFEKAKENHIHFVDETTGKVIDIDIEALSLELPEWFQVSNVDCRVYGSLN